MRDHRSRSLLLMVTIAVYVWPCMPGCQSAAERTFRQARLGAKWSSVPGSLDWAPNPYGFAVDIWIEDDAVQYYVVTTEDGIVAAKGIEEFRGDRRREILISGMALKEFLQVEGCYPFLSEKATRLPSGLELREWTYPPMARPRSQEDAVQASGVRLSTWAYLAHGLYGWPLKDQAGSLAITVAGKTTDWSDLLQEINCRAASLREIRIAGRGKEVRRQWWE